MNVDDITGFATVLVNGRPTPVSSANPLAVTVGSNVYSLIGVAADATNVSTANVFSDDPVSQNAPGISGTLTFASNVTVADGTAGNAVTASVAPAILRPQVRSTAAGLLSGDLFTMSIALDAVAYLRRNAIPAIDGYYNCHLDPVSARQLFADPDFKQLFQGQDAAKEFRMGRVIELLDLRFIPTTEAPIQQHPTIANGYIRRPIVLGEGALIEADFEGMCEADTAPADSVVNLIDGIAQVTRAPLDRLQQIIAQSWYWIGDFVAPTDFTVNAKIVPTASNAYAKRGIVIEHFG